MSLLKSRHIPIKIVAFALNGQNVVGADQTFNITQLEAEQRYFAENGTIYLIRPDHHINGRWIQYSENAILATFEQFISSAQGVVA